MDRIFAAIAVAASLWLCVSCCWFNWLVPVSLGALVVQFWLADKLVRTPLKKSVSRAAYTGSGVFAAFLLGVYAYKTAFEDGGSPPEDEQRFGVALSVLLLSVWCVLLRRPTQPVALYTLPVFAALTASAASGLVSGLSNPNDAEPRVSSFVFGVVLPSFDQSVQMAG